MPCKIMKNCGSDASNKIKTQLACILEADESTRMRMGNSIPHHHEDHIAGKGENSLQHYNLVHKFIPMHQALKIPRVKKLYCMCLKTTKQRSKRPPKEGVPQRDTPPGRTELHLIGCSIELIWTPKSKSNTSTPKINSQASKPKGISHVMSGIIC